MEDGLFGDSLSVPSERKIRLLEPCLGCGQRTIVRALLMPRSNEIQCICPCGHRRALPHDRYGGQFVAEKKAARAKKHGHGDADFMVTNQFRIFSRDGYRCVYCEGNDRAGSERSKLISKMNEVLDANTLTLDFSDPTIQAALAPMTIPVKQLYDFFGLVLDHVIARERTKKLWESKLLSPEQFQLAAREWVVTACTMCNSERASLHFRADDILLVYARWIFPDREKSEEARLMDLSKFVEVLKILAMSDHCESSQHNIG